MGSWLTEAHPTLVCSCAFISSSFSSVATVSPLGCGAKKNLEGGYLKREDQGSPCSRQAVPRAPRLTEWGMGHSKGNCSNSIILSTRNVGEYWEQLVVRLVCLTQVGRSPQSLAEEQWRWSRSSEAGREESKCLQLEREIQFINRTR